MKYTFIILISYDRIRLQFGIFCKASVWLRSPCVIFSQQITEVTSHSVGPHYQGHIWDRLNVT